MSISKFVYILILLLLSVGFWTILPIGKYLQGDVLLIVQLLWYFYGYMKWGRSKYKPLFKKPYIYVPLWMWLAIFLSFFSAYYYYGQSFIQSTITSRTLIYYLGLWVLLLIRPSEKDIIKAFDVFSVLFLIVFLLNNFAPFVITNSKLQMILDYKSGKINYEYNSIARFFGNYIDGFQFIYLSFAYRVQKIIKSFNYRDFSKALFFFAIIFIVQNRSNLLPSVIILIYGMIRVRSKYKPILMILFAIIVVFFASLTFDQWYALFSQTTSELNNDDYNRVKAFNYFFFEANPHWINNFIGNGVLSSHTTSLKANLMASGIYNSDMGFIGMWNYYGIIPIILYFVFIIKSFINKSIPFYVKAVAFHILMGSLTISHFMGNSSYSLWFFMFIYLYAYYNERPLILKKQFDGLRIKNNKLNTITEN